MNQSGSNGDDAVALIADALIKEKQKARWSRLAGAALIGASLVYAGTAFYMLAGALNGGADRIDEPHAAVVRLSGTIRPDSDASAEVVTGALERAFGNPDSRCVIMNINSPGGTPAQASLIHDRILALKASTGKKVYAVGADTMASGAYFVAVAADQIIVNRSSIVGSVGVIAKSFGLTSLMDRLGVDRRVYTAGANKSLGDPFSKETALQKAKLREILGEVHSHFIEAVKAGRGERLTLADEEAFSGDVWTGRQAVANGLADELGDMGTAKAHCGVDLIADYSPRKSPIEAVLPALAKAATGVAIEQVENLAVESVWSVR